MSHQSKDSQGLAVIAIEEEEVGVPHIGLVVQHLQSMTFLT